MIVISNAYFSLVHDGVLLEKHDNDLVAFYVSVLDKMFSLQ